jgi:hypothetical protein
MDKSGSVVVHPAYDDASAFSEGLAAVRIENTWGYIDKTGRLVIPIKFQDAQMFIEGVAAVANRAEELACPSVPPSRAQSSGSFVRRQ